jgi:ferredoxin
VKVRIDSNRCQGHGQCNLICPELFLFDEQGFAYVESEEVPAEFETQAERAFGSCPEHAISIAR